MKDITVSVDDETYRLSYIKAEEAGTSVSALVRAYLQQLANGSYSQRPMIPAVSEEEFERLRRLQDEVVAKIQASGVQFSAADRLPRDELYNRDAFRSTEPSVPEPRVSYSVQQ